jgi:four helix bundle protein
LPERNQPWTSYEEWLATIPSEMTADSLWKMDAYRLALFAADLGWYDATKLMQDKRTLDLANQLYRALGSVSANLAEGYSRGTGRDRARFYEYALGSARESRDWYYKSRHILVHEVTDHRIHLITRLVQLMLVMVPQQRGRTLGESGPVYRLNPSITELAPETSKDLSLLLHDIPMPVQI